MDPVERVKNMVRHTLVVKPDVSNRELLSRAKEIAPDAVEGMSLRQFHGKFRLPIVRFEMAPRRAKSNGAAKAEAGESRAETKSAAPAAKPAAASAGRKRPRRKSAGETVEISGAVRDVLIDFAVELAKAESRIELVSVMGGVDDYVKRIVSAADSAYGRRSTQPAA
jgi:hypothetical protein